MAIYQAPGKLTLVVCMALAVMAAEAQSLATQDISDPIFCLGPDDVILIRAIDAEEISEKPIKIGADGFISLPMIGRFKAAGLTTTEVQRVITDRLKRLFVNPDVSVSVVETHSQPVTVVGAVKNPGVLQLQGRKTLMEILSAAGGPLDDAGYTLQITRPSASGPLPLPDAHQDATGAYSIADVDLDAIMKGRDPAANIAIKPNDLITVPKARMVYVIGEVLKPGSIALADQKPLTVIQAVAIVSGFTKTAKTSEAKILRVTPGSASRTEVPVNLKLLLAGRGGDVSLQPEDILYVPNSLKKDVGLRAAATITTHK